jgi:hypothetical protein
MSEIQRYDLIGEQDSVHIGEFSDGGYVSYTDYRLLQSELEALRERWKEAEDLNARAQLRIEQLKGAMIYACDHIRNKSRPESKIVQVMEMTVLGYDLTNTLREVAKPTQTKGE